MADESLDTRIARLFARPALVDEICAYVANGGSPIHLCEIWDVPYGRVSGWLAMEPERWKRYQAALTEHDTWQMHRMLLETYKIATADVRDLFDDRHALKPTSEWPDHVAKAVAAIEVAEIWEGTGKDRIRVGELKKVKLYDKTKGIEMMLKKLGAFIDRKEIIGTMTLADLVTASMKDDGEK
jgi:hypothetical protein